MQIHVFKTNLTDLQRISDVEPVLNIHPDILRWNVDLNDCDNILRVESKQIDAKEIEQLLSGAGFFCEHL